MEQIIGSFEFKQETARLFEERRIERERAIVDNRARLTHLYDELTDKRITDILQAEREIAKCRDCDSMPSRKSSRAELVPIIGLKDGVLVISHEQCRVARRYHRQRQIERRVQSAHIPDKYIDKTLADYVVDGDNADAVAYARSVMRTRRGAFFYGECGTGKTYLASLIAQEFLDAGNSVMFVKVPNLLADIRNTFNDGAKMTETQVVAEAVNADLLVLDDFGMEKPTRFAGTTLCSIIDARYDREGSTTIITSNYPLEQIRHELNNAVDGKNYNGSRIYDRCRAICRPILFKGNSRRR